MADRKPAAEHSAQDEAHELAEEAVQEMHEGHDAEARFVLEEARRLDPKTVENVLHREAKQRSGVPGTEPAVAPARKR